MIARTYEYESREFDPAAARALTGLDYMRGVMRGDYPSAPIAATMGFTLVGVETGRAVFEGSPQRFVYNPIGVVHGGWFATLLDSAMGCAVHSTLAAGKAYTTIDLSVSMVRGLDEHSGLVRAEGKVLHVGSRVITAEGRVTGADGTLYAHGTTTCIVLAPR
ncbi:MAG TPA: PaaI family thioesterase [Kofleriaceae bacterium]|jgi:uncharacterized protein (TIGR00369 family)|nr:PaaI family thioesterase [Kofleriaceae bacterium]